jgi:hypothetical protein
MIALAVTDDGLTAEAVPPTGPLPPGPVPPAVGLSWGIKLSFLRYVAGTADGRCSVTDGASTSEGHEYLFEPAGGWVDPATGSAVLQFRGDVRISAHHGFLFLQFQDPWLEVDRHQGRLTITDPSAEPGEPPRMPLLIFDLQQSAAPGAEDTLLTGRAVAAQLTAEGSAFFGGSYDPGARFDDFSYHVPANALTSGTHDDSA